MQLNELPFPITIVAQDGWAACKESLDEVRMWSVGAIASYNKLGFIVADSSGAMWRLTRIEPERRITLWDRLPLRIVSVPVRITVESLAGDPLQLFREQFAKALEKDDDCLTQFHSEEKIRAVLNGTESLVKLTKTLHKMRVT
ncbi:MAG TPA: hypothetical protein VFE51_29760 [Verrucomicrobiae bacterium]|nr:hypothetical protein [Verrucomicrobiae bacterium]